MSTIRNNFLVQQHEMVLRDVERNTQLYKKSKEFITKQDQKEQIHETLKHSLIKDSTCASRKECCKEDLIKINKDQQASLLRYVDETNLLLKDKELEIARLHGLVHRLEETGISIKAEKDKEIIRGLLLQLQKKEEVIQSMERKEQKLKILKKDDIILQEKFIFVESLVKKKDRIIATLEADRVHLEAQNRELNNILDKILERPNNSFWNLLFRPNYVKIYANES